MLDVVWGIFDQDGDGTLTKAEFMDASARPFVVGASIASVRCVCDGARQVLEARASRGGSRRNRQGLNDCVAAWLKGILG